MITYLDAVQVPLGPAVVCLGFFDGVHKGHIALLRQGKQASDKLGLPLYVHTYDVPPASLIKLNSATAELTPLAEKARLLMDAGADRVVVSHFDDALMHTTGEAFFRNVLINQLGARHLIIGFDHRFGYRGDMDADQLSALCKAEGVGLNVVPAVMTDTGQLISSSAIRDALRLGNINLAEDMMGRAPSADLVKRMQATAHHVQNQTIDGGHKA